MSIRLERSGASFLGWVLRLIHLNVLTARAIRYHPALRPGQVLLLPDRGQDSSA